MHCSILFEFLASSRCHVGIPIYLREPRIIIVLFALFTNLFDSQTWWVPEASTVCRGLCTRICSWEGRKNLHGYVTSEAWRRCFSCVSGKTLICIVKHYVLRINPSQKQLNSILRKQASLYVTVHKRDEFSFNELNTSRCVHLGRFRLNLAYVSTTAIRKLICLLPAAKKIHVLHTGRELS